MLSYLDVVFNVRLSLNKTGCALTTENLESILPTAFNFLDEIWFFGVGTAIIGSINFIMSYGFVTCLNHAAEAQVFKIRRLFLEASLRQDIGWYDTHQTGDFASKMAE